VVEIGRITAESFDYSHELVDRLRGRFTLKEAPEPEGHYHVEARSTGFRRVVVEAYNHTCDICGIRVVTPEGRTAVAASHIVPWSVSHNDDPRNGMALCGLHHWTFDQGMIGVTPECQIRVSPVISADEESAKPLLLLAESLLHQPTDSMLRPAKAALHWHWENVFRAETLPRLL
jgi:putative restriction endonuclease